MGTDMRPVIALVPGDCTGIGPEQTARILHDGRLSDVARLVVVGDARVLDLGMRQAGVCFPYRTFASPADCPGARSQPPRPTAAGDGPG
ncbi:MAG TPA: hypothetical protein VGA77_01185 [Propylenella sp.]